MRIKRIWIAAALLLASSLAWADAPPAGVDPALWEKMVEVDRIGAGIKDLSAKFEQKKYTALLRKPLVSSGEIRVKGSALVWDTKLPEPTVMRIDEREIKLYYPKQSVMEIYPVDRQLGSLAASPLPRLEVLRKYFTFEEIPVRELTEKAGPGQFLALKMTPTDASLREHLQQVRVLLDRARGLIVKAEMTDADGDRTQIEFSEIRANTGLKDQDVALEVPASVKVSKPLEGLGGTSAKE